jgi:hypothetical protein
MEIKGLVWVGTATDRYDATVAFFREMLGLSVFHQSPALTVLVAPGGEWVEVFGPGHEHYGEFDTGPVVEFLVEDLAAWSSCTRTTAGSSSPGRTSGRRMATSTASPAGRTRPGDLAVRGRDGGGGEAAGA